jgi:hypothetical protein
LKNPLGKYRVLRFLEAFFDPFRLDRHLLAVSIPILVPELAAQTIKGRWPPLTADKQSEPVDPGCGSYNAADSWAAWYCSEVGSEYWAMP